MKKKLNFGKDCFFASNKQLAKRCMYKSIKTNALPVVNSENDERDTHTTRRRIEMANGPRMNTRTDVEQFRWLILLYLVLWLFTDSLSNSHFVRIPGIVSVSSTGHIVTCGRPGQRRRRSHADGEDEADMQKSYKVVHEWSRDCFCCFAFPSGACKRSKIYMPADGNLCCVPWGFWNRAELTIWEIGRTRYGTVSTACAFAVRLGESAWPFFLHMAFRRHTVPVREVKLFVASKDIVATTQIAFCVSVDTCLKTILRGIVVSADPEWRCFVNSCRFPRHMFFSLHKKVE